MIGRGCFWDGFRKAHGTSYTRGFDARFMLDEATLGLMMMAFGWIVYHCREWKKERVQFSQWLEVRSDSFSTLAGDAMEALEDIVDGLHSGGSKTSIAHPSNPIGELLTAFLISKTGMPLDHASTPGPEGPIHEATDDTPSEAEI